MVVRVTENKLRVTANTNNRTNILALTDRISFSLRAVLLESMTKMSFIFVFVI